MGSSNREVTLYFVDFGISVGTIITLRYYLDFQFIAKFPGSNITAKELSESALLQDFCGRLQMGVI